MFYVILLSRIRHVEGKYYHCSKQNIPRLRRQNMQTVLVTQGNASINL
jgi:hypothetical protein